MSRATALPLFRWAGSKRKLLPRLLTHVPGGYSRYVEPFAGSGCLFFTLKPECAVLGDINTQLMEAYDVIRQYPRRVARTLSRFPTDRDSYYRIRSVDPKSLRPIPRAARFAYLNRFCFNGVYRVNRRGEFNVPWGTRTGAIPSEDDFVRCAAALRRAELRATDYRQCLADVKRGDFVYLDPPYASHRRNTYGEYGYGCFNENDIPALMSVLRKIDRVGAVFLLSYSPHPAFDELPRRWHSATLRVRRHIAGFAEHRRIVRELVVSNRRLDQGSHQ